MDDTFLRRFYRRQIFPLVVAAVLGGAVLLLFGAERQDRLDGFQCFFAVVLFVAAGALWILPAERSRRAAALSQGVPCQPMKFLPLQAALSIAAPLCFAAWRFLPLYSSERRFFLLALMALAVLPFALLLFAPKTFSVSKLLRLTKAEPMPRPDTADLTWPIVLSAVPLAFVGLWVFRFLDYTRLLLWSGGLGLVMTLLATRRAKDVRRIWLVRLALFAAFSFAAAGFVAEANAFFALEEPRYEEATVLETHESSGLFRSWDATVQPEGESEALKIGISSNGFHYLHVGDEVRLGYQEGALGIPYADLLISVGG